MQNKYLGKNTLITESKLKASGRYSSVPMSCWEVAYVVQEFTARDLGQ